MSIEGDVYLPAPQTPRKILILVFPDITLLDFSGPAQVFIMAARLATEAGLPSPYEVTLVSADGGLVMAEGGIGLQSIAFDDISEDQPIDTAVVPGGWGVWRGNLDPRVLAWVRAMDKRAKRLVSVCIGAFILADAGVLSGRRVATHWHFCQTLRQANPQIIVEDDQIFIRDGHVWSSAGVTAGIDLSLALVEEDLGHIEAVRLAQFLVLFLKRHGGQAQFSRVLAAQIADAGGRFAELHAWMADNLALDLCIASLADRAGMTPRTFARAYREGTGMTPAKSVEALRVEMAKRCLLDAAPQTPSAIAAKCGFIDEERMRRAFLRVVGISPSEYKLRFGQRAAAE
ncbi:MAG: DJ-1/PfpI family protein [Beijerinckiaceae bacterium]|nr:DJ-1/PfpI family protein [Beijerinckiaceae bacterium]